MKNRNCKMFEFTHTHIRSHLSLKIKLLIVKLTVQQPLCNVTEGCPSSTVTTLQRKIFRNADRNEA